MSSIGGINGSAMMHGMGAMREMHRPDQTRMAEKLFSQLDASGQGYIQKSDLQSAFDALSSSSSGVSNSSLNVDDLFSSLDTNSDGKVTRQEFTDTLKKLQDGLEQQLQDGRMQSAIQAASGVSGVAGMPPPPPQGGGDEGFTKEDLSKQLEKIGGSDSKQASLISSIVQNFDTADSNGDGKVSFQEAMAYQKSATSSGTAQDASAAASGSSTTSSASTEKSSDAKLMTQIMKLMHAYMAKNGPTSSALSVTA